MSLPVRSLAALVAGALVFAAAGAALSQPPAADDALAQARLVSYQLRAGRYDLAPQGIAALEAAAQAHPKDVRVWNALGVAYFEGVTAAFHANRFADIPPLVTKARDAHARALELSPDDAEALSGHGTALAIMSGFMRRPDLGRQGLAQMDRAVALAPDNTIVRLQRGFTHLGVGPALWNPTTIEADLKRLIAISDGSQPGDVLHVLLGDLYAETGNADLARAEYAAAQKGVTTRGLGDARLEALAAGVASPSEFTRLRNEVGRNCAMCHGS